MRLFEAYENEAKASKLLDTRTFRLRAQLPDIPVPERTRLAHEILLDGTKATRQRLTALGQAKVAYCRCALRLARAHGAKAFATIVPQEAPRPETVKLRKDYAFLFERFFYFLNSRDDTPMGYLVFDERDKSASHVLLNQIGEYFIRTQKGRTRSRLIIPEPFFVHSDLTSLVQLADIAAYVISWGVRLKGMKARAREELADIAGDVLKLRFQHDTPGGHTQWGFKLIHDLELRAPEGS